MTKLEPDFPMVDVPSCLLCGSSAFSVAFEEVPYAIRRCTDCTFVWVSPRLDPEGLRALYGRPEYWTSDTPRIEGYGDYRKDEPLYLKTFRRRMELVLRHVAPGGRALDVGCAAGFCMKVLDESGFEAYGVEVSPEIARHARDVLGFDTVHIGTIETSAFPTGSFDLVTMWDVVEHVPDPIALLAKANELLKPTGVLFIETQNVDSAFARLLGPRWQHYKHREHLYHFNRSTIEQLLRATGFRVVALTPRYGGKYVSFGFISERASRLHPALSAALRPLSLLKNAGIYVNLMDEMVVVARPDRADR